MTISGIRRRINMRILINNLTLSIFFILCFTQFVQGEPVSFKYGENLTWAGEIGDLLQVEASEAANPYQNKTNIYRGELSYVKELYIVVDKEMIYIGDIISITKYVPPVLIPEDPVPNEEVEIDEEVVEEDPVPNEEVEIDEEVVEDEESKETTEPPKTYTMEYDGIYLSFSAELAARQIIEGGFVGIQAVQLREIHLLKNLGEGPLGNHTGITWEQIKTAGNLVPQDYFRSYSGRSGIALFNAIHSGILSLESPDVYSLVAKFKESGEIDSAELYKLFSDHGLDRGSIISLVGDIGIKTGINNSFVSQAVADIMSTRGYANLTGTMKMYIHSSFKDKKWKAILVAAKRHTPEHDELYTEIIKALAKDNLPYTLGKLTNHFDDKLTNQWSAIIKHRLATCVTTDPERVGNGRGRLLREDGDLVEKVWAGTIVFYPLSNIIKAFQEE